MARSNTKGRCLVSPNWRSDQEPDRRFDVHYGLKGQCEPKLVLYRGEAREIVRLSEAESRGIISRKNAAHIRAVSDLIRRASARLSRRP
jgi:hypothetical protein